MSAIRSAPQTSRPRSKEEIASLRALPYAQYLRTRWWYGRRNEALRQARYRCQSCESKRELQVHHTSYERLGDEADSDLSVLCRGCHLGEHRVEVQSHVALYARMLSAVVGEQALEDLSDIIDEAKRRLAKAEVPIKPDEFNAAVARVLPRFPFTPPKGKEELFECSEYGQPLTKAEACEALRALGIAAAMRHMPEVKPLSIRQQERRKALQLIAQAITEQVQRCEEVEAGEAVKETRY